MDEVKPILPPVRKKAADFSCLLIVCRNRTEAAALSGWWFCVRGFGDQGGKRHEAKFGNRNRRAFVERK
jgi:hypothetical protein